MALSTPTNGGGTSPRSRRIICGRNTSSGRRMKKNRKNSSIRNHNPQSRCPTKPDSGFFAPSSSPDWEAPCWPPFGPVCRVRPQGGERTRPRPPRPEFGPVSGQLKTAKDGQQKGCERKAGQRVWVGKPSTPGSQWPAEPATSGFSGDSTPHKKCGSVNGPLGQAVGHRIRKSRISGKNLWVRLWVWPQNPDGRNV